MLSVHGIFVEICSFSFSVRLHGIFVNMPRLLYVLCMECRQGFFNFYLLAFNVNFFICYTQYLIIQETIEGCDARIAQIISYKSFFHQTPQLLILKLRHTRDSEMKKDGENAED